MSHLLALLDGKYYLPDAYVKTGYSSFDPNIPVGIRYFENIMEYNQSITIFASEMQFIWRRRIRRRLWWTHESGWPYLP